MKVIATHEGFAPGAHAGIRESIEAWAQKHLEPMLSPFKGEPQLLAAVTRRAKGSDKYAVTLRMHLPRKHMLVAHGENADTHAALAQAEERLLREVKQYKDRLHHQAEYRRKARRARLREFKAAKAAQPPEVIQQARGGIEPHLPQLERVVRRELAYLRGSGELPANYPTAQDIVDEAVLAVIAAWRPGESADKVRQQLLRAAFKVIDAETKSRRRYGEQLSLEASLPEDAQDQAEAMVEEEIYEFYQPDELLQLSDVLIDESVVPPEDELETPQREFSLETLSHLPALWRRAWMLAEFERLAMADIADVMEMEPAQMEQMHDQAWAFINEHLRQAGF